MKSPNAPPRTKPMPPEMIVLPRQDSIAICTWLSQRHKLRVKVVNSDSYNRLTLLAIMASWSLIPAVSLPPAPMLRPGSPGKLMMALYVACKYRGGLAKAKDGCQSLGLINLQKISRI